MDQWLIAICGPLAVWLAMDVDDKRKKWAPVVAMIAQPAWFYATWQAMQIGMFFTCFFYLYCWLKGLNNFWVKPWRKRRNHPRMVDLRLAQKQRAQHLKTLGHLARADGWEGSEALDAAVRWLEFQDEKIANLKRVVNGLEPLKTKAQIRQEQEDLENAMGQANSSHIEAMVACSLVSNGIDPREVLRTVDVDLRERKDAVNGSPLIGSRSSYRTPEENARLIGKGGAS